MVLQEHKVKFDKWEHGQKTLEQLIALGLKVPVFELKKEDLTRAKWGLQSATLTHMCHKPQNPLLFTNCSHPKAS